MLPVGPILWPAGFFFQKMWKGAVLFGPVPSYYQKQNNPKMKKLYNLQQKIWMLALLLGIGTSMMWAQNQIIVEVWDSNNQPVANYPVWVKVGAPLNFTLSGTTDLSGAFQDSVPTLTGPTVFTFMTYDCQGNRVSSVKTFNSISSVFVDTLIVNCQTPKPGLNPFFSTSGSSLNISFLGWAGAWAMPAGIDILYSWNFGDGSSGGGEMTSHTYAQAGSYNTCMTVQVYDSIFDIFPFNQVSCSTVVAGSASTSCQAYFTVNQNPISPAFTFIDSSSVSSVPTNGYVVHQWTFGDGSTDTGSTVTHTYNAPGRYYVCLDLEVRDGNGNLVCSDTNCDSVLNGNMPNPVTCSATFVGYQDSIQPNTIYTYSTSTVNASGQPYTTVMVWNYGDGDTAMGNNLYHTYASPGTYQVCLQLSVYDASQQLVCTSNTCKSISVNAPAGPFCQASYIVDTVNSLGGNVYIWNTATPAYNDPSYSTSFSWDFGDGSSSSQPFPTHNYANPGVYAVCLTITSADSASNICTDTHCDTLGVDSLGHLIYKNATGFTLNVLDPNSIGLDENEISKVGIYPNPAGDFVKVDMANLKGELNWSIRDLKGSLVKRGTTGAGEDYRIDVASLRPGLYLISLEQEELPLSHQKLMIER